MKLSGQPRSWTAAILLASLLTTLPPMAGGQSFESPLVLAERTPRPNTLFGQAFAVGDFNARGAPDLAVSNQDGRVTLFYGEPVLDSTPDLTITGNADSGFGHTLAAGDFNGDGKMDLAVSAPDGLLNDDGTLVADGQVFVYWGGTSFNSRADVTINHPPFDPNIPIATSFFGDSLAVADVNGDRADDLIVGIPGEDQVQVFLGGRNFGRRTDFTLSGPEVFSFFGSPVAAGDVTGDGRIDLIVGASQANNVNGVVYVYAGSSSGLFNRSPLIVANPDPTGANQAFGGPLAVADLDNDGALDLLVGAPSANISNIEKAGRIYAFFGPLPSSRPPMTIQNPQPQSGVRFGSAFAVGDLTGDGLSDLAAAEADSTVSNPKPGRVLIFAAVKTAQGTALSSPPTILTLAAPQPNDLFGFALLIADLNKDSLPDLAVSAPGVTIRGNKDAGQAFVFRTKKPST
jgi:hypothetical protein